MKSSQGLARHDNLIRPYRAEGAVSLHAPKA